MSIDFSSPRSVYLQIADDLRAQIDKGAYEPGDKLPSRKKLADHYQVAPETVKKALGELERERLVETQSTRGTYVIKKPEEPGPSPEFLQLMELVNRLSERMDVLEAEVRGQHPSPPEGAHPARERQTDESAH